MALDAILDGVVRMSHFWVLVPLGDVRPQRVLVPMVAAALRTGQLAVGLVVRAHDVHAHLDRLGVALAADQARSVVGAAADPADVVVRIVDQHGDRDGGGWRRRRRRCGILEKSGVHVAVSHVALQGVPVLVDAVAVRAEHALVGSHVDALDVLDGVATPAEGGAPADQALEAPAAAVGQQNGGDGRLGNRLHPLLQDCLLVRTAARKRSKNGSQSYSTMYSRRKKDFGILITIRTQVKCSRFIHF